MAKIVVFQEALEGLHSPLTYFLAKEINKPKWRDRGWKVTGNTTYSNYGDDGLFIHHKDETVLSISKTEQFEATISSRHPYEIVVHRYDRTRGLRKYWLRKSVLDGIKDLEEMVAGFRSKNGNVILIRIVR